MKCLDLFTGIGGMGRLLPVDTIMYCEKDPYCRKVLEKRMCDGDLHNAPIHEDIRPRSSTTISLSAGFHVRTLAE